MSPQLSASAYTVYSIRAYHLSKGHGLHHVCCAASPRLSARSSAALPSVGRTVYGRFTHIVATLQKLIETYVTLMAPKDGTLMQSYYQCPYSLAADIRTPCTMLPTQCISCGASNKAKKEV